MDREMIPGERVEVRLNGFEDDEWFAATVTGKARKQQVTLDEHPFGREPFTYEADENSIAEWRPLANQALPACFADGDGPEEVDELPAPPRKTIPAADRELLELAARALGAVFEEVDGEGYGNLHFPDGSVLYSWNPVHFNGDTFELAVTLGILDMNDRLRRTIEEEQTKYGRVEATRRAFTRIAAEIGKAMLV